MKRVSVRKKKKCIMVEDAETLSVRNQPEIYIKMLVFRDHLRNLLNSRLYTDLKADKRDWHAVLMCIYNSPQEALDIALKRELQDLKRDGYSEEAMREFIRDMIANINGMYHVMCINEMMH